MCAVSTDRSCRASLVGSITNRYSACLAASSRITSTSGTTIISHPRHYSIVHAKQYFVQLFFLSQTDLFFLVTTYIFTNIYLPGLGDPARQGEWQGNGRWTVRQRPRQRRRQRRRQRQALLVRVSNGHGMAWHTLELG